MKELVVLIMLDEDPGLSRDLTRALAHHGLQVSSCCNGAEFQRSFQSNKADLAIIGVSTNGDGVGLAMARWIRDWDKKVPVILIADASSEDLAIAALRLGINDYFKAPLPFADVARSVLRCISESSARDICARPETTHSELIGGERMVGDSLTLREIKEYILKVAKTDSNALITGETGTGKELVAELIHKNSRRRERPLVRINCAAIPDSLLESELFGHERGAFTGASSLQEGRLKLADGGTVFFDEIGDMSSSAQAKILRVIESKEVERLGGRRSQRLDVRFIAATNRDVDTLAKADNFRKDLYYRLNVARIHLPPLRERRGDIASLSALFVRESNRRSGAKVEGFAEDSLQSFLIYTWPGNVRELKNLVEAVFINPRLSRIRFQDLPEQYRSRFTASDGLPCGEPERVLLALLSCEWNKSKAAEKLHWSRMTLYRKMAKYRLVSGGKRPADGPAVSERTTVTSSGSRVT